MNLPELSLETTQEAAAGESEIRRWEYLALAVLVLVGAYLRQLSMARSLDFDELTTALYFVQQPTLWDTVSKVVEFNNHVGYSVLARLSQVVLTPGEVALRLPAYLFGVFTLPLLWSLGRRFLDRWGALVATAFLVFNPMHVAYSESARGYSGLVFFSVLSTYLALKNLTHSTSGGWVALTLSNVYGLWTHLYAMFPLSGLLIYLVSESKGQPRLRKPILLTSLGTAAGSLFLYAPTLSGLLHNLRPRPNGPFNAHFPVVAWGELLGISHSLALTASALAMGLAAVLAIRRKPWLSLSAVVGGLVPFTLVWFRKRVYALARFFIYFLPYFGLCLGYLVSRTSRKLRPLLASALLASMILGGAPSWKPEEAPFRRTTFQALELMRTHPDALLISNGGGGELFQYYSGPQPILLAQPSQEFAHQLMSAPVVICIDRQRDWENEFFGVVRRQLEKEGAQVVVDGPDRILLLDRRKPPHAPPPK